MENESYARINKLRGKTVTCPKCGSHFAFEKVVVGMASEEFFCACKNCKQVFRISPEEEKRLVGE